METKIKYKISVVVPIFGVERFIERCARSLFSQTLNELEYIFVNDCTIDNSMQILYQIIEEYPHKKRDIKIINHNTNKGLPQARRTGVMACSGEYIAHVDSDDWVSPAMFERMYSASNGAEYDIVSCNYYKSDGLIHVKVKKDESQKYLQGPVWNKIVKRRLYTNNEIEYPTANKAEDGALLTQLSYFAENRIHIEDALYYYFNNPESMCRIATKENCFKKLKEECENVELRERFLKKHGCLPEDKASLIKWKYLSRKNLMPYIHETEVYDIWRNTYPEINSSIVRIGGIRWQMKLHFLCVYYKQFWFLKAIGQL